MSYVTRSAAITAMMIAIVGFAAPSAVASGGKPTHEQDRAVVTFADDFLHDLCGIDTTTTMTQHFEVTTFPDRIPVSSSPASRPITAPGCTDPCG
jgi:hypothetical protein